MNPYKGFKIESLFMLKKSGMQEFVMQADLIKTKYSTYGGNTLLKMRTLKDAANIKNNLVEMITTLL